MSGKIDEEMYALLSEKYNKAERYVVAGKNNSNIIQYLEPFLKFWQKNQLFLKATLIVMALFPVILMVWISGTEYQNLSTVIILIIFSMFGLGLVYRVGSFEKKFGFWQLQKQVHPNSFFHRKWV